MGEREFLENEIRVDETAERVVRTMEAKVLTEEMNAILKDTLNNFAQKEDEIRGLDKFIEKMDVLERVYLKEQGDIQHNTMILLKEHAKREELIAVIDDLSKAIKDLREYRRMLIAMREDIQNDRKNLKKDVEKQQLKDISDGMQNAYNDYIRKNENIIQNLVRIRQSLKIGA